MGAHLFLDSVSMKNTPEYNKKFINQTTRFMLTGERRWKFKFFSEFINFIKETHKPDSDSNAKHPIQIIELSFLVCFTPTGLEKQVW